MQSQLVIIKEIYGKMLKLAILLVQFDPYRGVGGNLTCFLDSPHMVSYYLPIHFMALNAILMKIIGGGGGVHMNFKLFGWYL